MQDLWEQYLRSSVMRPDIIIKNQSEDQLQALRQITALRSPCPVAKFFAIPALHLCFLFHN